MRQSHQKSRSRGRGRKPQNPLGRNYESNGPDVKIRGNAAHIAEKYSSLARDAQSNGDTVMAENYLQHAEHYNRIVAAAQAQKAEENQANQQANQNGRGPQPDIEGTPAEVALQDQAENANSDVEGDEAAVARSESDADNSNEAEPPKKQKSGRGRRTKSANGANGSDSSESVEDVAVAAVAESAVSNDEEGVPVEAISEDAAKLPESITGGMLAEKG